MILNLIIVVISQVQTHLILKITTIKFWEITKGKIIQILFLDRPPHRGQQHNQHQGLQIIHRNRNSNRGIIYNPLLLIIKIQFQKRILMFSLKNIKIYRQVILFLEEQNQFSKIYIDLISNLHRLRQLEKILAKIFMVQL